MASTEPGGDRFSEKPRTVPFSTGPTCRHVFQTFCVQANGDVVCSILDGRGDFVLGNIREGSVPEIFHGAKFQELRSLVRSTPDSFCLSIGKPCPLKRVSCGEAESLPLAIRFLQIEPTTACNLSCLTCLVRDLKPGVTWRDAFRDGGPRFLAWDGARRFKQALADRCRPWSSLLPGPAPGRLSGFSRALSRTRAMLLRGRPAARRAGTLPLPLLKKVVDEAGPSVERVDLFNYGEPFLYPDLLEALRHIRARLPRAVIAINTGGLALSEAVENALVGERLADWVVFSIDGCDAESYARYHVGGRFETAIGNLERLQSKSKGSTVRLAWQYIVFRWNDRDAQLRKAIALAQRKGLRLWFDFARTWGRSPRRLERIAYLAPYLRPPNRD